MRPAFLSEINTGRHGFSLVELAIVLAVIGILVGAIWIYAGQAWETSRRQQLAEEVNAVVNNVHALYAGQANISGSVATLIPKLATQNTIPSTMLRTGGGCTNGTCADGPWGPGGNPAAGTFGICAWAAGPATNSTCATNNAATQYFGIELSGLTLASCINIVPPLSASGSAPGLLDVVINGKSIMNAATPGVTHSLPVQVTDAKNLCTAAGAVDFVYRLQAPAN